MTKSGDVPQDCRNSRFSRIQNTKKHAKVKVEEISPFPQKRAFRFG